MKKTVIIIAFIMILMCVLFSACTNKSDVQPIADTGEWKESDSYGIKLENGTFTTDKSYIVCIEKKKNKDFVVLNMTDIQLGDGEIDFESEPVRKAIKTVQKLIDEVKPDLITITGDQGYGTEKSILYVGNLIDQYGIPWAPVYGNHDDQEEILTTAQQATLYENSFKNCLFKSGPNNLATVQSGSVAYGNYVVNVVEKDNSELGFHVVKSLIFLNSGGSYDYEKNKKEYEGQKPVNDQGYPFLSEEQIDWYKWAVQGVQPYGKDGQVKSNIFLHIPIYAYNLAFEAAFKTDISIFDFEEYDKVTKYDNVVRSYADKSIWNEGYTDSVGEKRENIASPRYDDHVFDAILDFDDDVTTDFVSTDAIICGHDHINNFIVKYEGVNFVYGLKTGSGCYANDDLNGGTVITINDDGEGLIYHHFVDVKVTKFVWWLYVLIVGGCLIVAGVIVFIVLLKFKIISFHKK